MADDGFVDRFTAMLADDTESSVPLFTKLSEEPVSIINAELFDLFDRNFRLRTFFTIPEVFLNGLVTANYLCREGIAAAGAIVADESGVMSGEEGGVERVHSVLLSRAFDYHRTRAFGLEGLPEVRLLTLMRSLSRAKLGLACSKMTIETARAALGGISQQELLSLIIRECRQMQSINDFAQLSETIGNSEKSHDALTGIFSDLIERLYDLLRNEGVLEDTIRYCESQLQMQRSVVPARILGRAAMHETLADGLLQAIEEVFFQPFLHLRLYTQQEYAEYIAPYFLAHHDAKIGSFVEAEHAKRMRRIIGSFLDCEESLQAAEEEAARFKEEQSALWKGIMQTAEEMKNFTPYHKTPIETISLKTETL